MQAYASTCWDSIQAFATWNSLAIQFGLLRTGIRLEFNSEFCDLEFTWNSIRAFATWNLNSGSQNLAYAYVSVFLELTEFSEIRNFEAV